MAKEIELHIEIDKQGNVVVTPKGTQGKECLDILKFLDKLEGVEVKEKHVFFNYSVPHGFPQGVGEQISIRIFGDFVYDDFNLGTIYE